MHYYMAGQSLSSTDVLAHDVCLQSKSFLFTLKSDLVHSALLPQRKFVIGVAVYTFVGFVSTVHSLDVHY